VRRVVKLGGRVQGDPALGTLLASAPEAATGGLVVMHGGGDEVSTLMRALGHEPRFVGGRRVTGDAEIDLVRMVLSGSANKRLVSLLSGAGLRAVGVSGEDGGLLQAQVAPGAPLGRVGERITAHPALLHDLLAAGWLPVVSPLGRDADDPGARALNLNGDDAAAAIAVGLGADELLLVADVPGVLVDGAPVPTLTPDEAQDLVVRGIAAGGMAAKLDAGHAALRGGVARVRIGTLAALQDPDHGTLLLPPAAPAPSA
jgi:acetylglutamate kinase